LALVSDADRRADFVMAAYDENQRKLTSFAYALTRDADAADDLVQETFLRLVKEHAAGREPDNVTAWLYRVCANLATSRGRRGVVARRFLERRPAEETEVVAAPGSLRHFAELEVDHTSAYGTWDLMTTYAAATDLTDHDIVCHEGRRIVFVDPGTVSGLPLTTGAGVILPAFLLSDLYRDLVDPH
jgi:DNA-directed RNA polymerase specialized sigma24 family protein